eukprot:scaffold169795_cov33-Prasinocladus_malaysianus.AAC.1
MLPAPAVGDPPTAPITTWPPDAAFATTPWTRAPAWRPNWTQRLALVTASAGSSLAGQMPLHSSKLVAVAGRKPAETAEFSSSTSSSANSWWAL